MSLRKINLRTMLPLLWLILAGPVFALSDPDAKKKKNVEAEAVQPENPVPEAFEITEERTPYTVVAPDVPNEIEFCGKVIDLRKNDYRERMDRELMAMMYMHSSTLSLIKRANRYFPVIEAILKENQVPDDIKYLACIESSLNPWAISSVKAVGMWQFMPETAKQYGLEVSDYVDERYQIEKETQAACAYLKEAYAKYGDWVTACASYNTGTSRISSELTRQQVDNGLDLWLVEETRRYVFRILACKEFLAHPRKFGFVLHKEQLYQPFHYKDTLVSGKVSNWVDFAKQQGITFYDLKYHNTWIRSDSLPNADARSYKVSIPLPEDRFFDKNSVVVHQKSWITD